MKKGLIAVSLVFFLCGCGKVAETPSEVFTDPAEVAEKPVETHIDDFDTMLEPDRSPWDYEYITWEEMDGTEDEYTFFCKRFCVRAIYSKSLDAISSVDGVVLYEDNFPNWYYGYCKRYYQNPDDPNEYTVNVEKIRYYCCHTEETDDGGELLFLITERQKNLCDENNYEGFYEPVEVDWAFSTYIQKEEAENFKNGTIERFDEPEPTEDENLEEGETVEEDETLKEDENKES